MSGSFKAFGISIYSFQCTINKCALYTLLFDQSVEFAKFVKKKSNILYNVVWVYIVISDLYDMILKKKSLCDVRCSPDNIFKLPVYKHVLFCNQIKLLL